MGGRGVRAARGLVETLGAFRRRLHGTCIVAGLPRIAPVLKPAAPA